MQGGNELNGAVGPLNALPQPQKRLGARRGTRRSARRSVYGALFVPFCRLIPAGSFCLPHLREWSSHTLGFISRALRRYTLNERNATLVLASDRHCQELPKYVCLLCQKR